jgi:hypothetical protein
MLQDPQRDLPDGVPNLVSCSTRCVPLKCISHGQPQFMDSTDFFGRNQSAVTSSYACLCPSLKYLAVPGEKIAHHGEWVQSSPLQLDTRPLSPAFQLPGHK